MQYLISDHFLEIAGLTRFHIKVISWSLIAAVLILAIVWTLHKFAVFHDVNFQQQWFKDCRVIYFNHRGPYDGIGNAFQRGKNIFSLHFKISKMFGIYYDNPKETSDKAMCRSTIGIMVNQGELQKVDQFFKEFPSFQTTVLPKTPCISTRYPYVNILSIFLVVAKVYPRMQKYISEKGIKTGPFMEIYHLLSERGNNEVEVIAPLEKTNSFMLWEDDNEPITIRKRD